MLEKSFDRIYTKFKLHFYQAVFTKFQTREASLTAVETFCMEIIRALDEPTINEFASFANISSPNAPLPGGELAGQLQHVARADLLLEPGVFDAAEEGQLALEQLDPQGVCGEGPVPQRPPGIPPAPQPEDLPFRKRAGR